ncbi:MAG: protease Do [Ferrovum sp. 37-45-19]|jgi:serine protease Do|uniref:DegQ family serine endoprotease n=1 Tax=Ferrovum sp. JA12 TaxID=1356299 RepID=UPI0007036412|nr:DegQ family serine endoprotease [Ferrovum sp. JA12]OYV80302.1 MAG: protease Do [Ferrovum sp. 21-44-67]OYV95048.1 MAG: protease Do [Ferrovum sp. 37-45-19]OZB32195.1 MAG: protease Do [Ferrovum sp. 34-44-207]HQT80894.1 DegQ family serine endoprotease [Ferrovaceae bacterium]KRH78736.1 putative periplasmic serine endoprotease DegP-like precursor [Ferrovum sp. JA12]
MKRLFYVFLALFLTVQVNAESLPDFTGLVEKLSPAVVNISTTTKARAMGKNDMNGNIDPNDPMYQFFRRFGIPMMPGMPGMPGSPNQGEVPESHSMGSGFIISPEGYILTNTHVVEGADEVLVTLNDKREFKAKVIGTDAKSDVAVLKINAKDLPSVKLGNSDNEKVGEWVIAIGSPFGFESTVTKGIISAKGRSLPDETLVPFIQTDVPINPGNSGGPLINMNGEVIGINSQIYSKTGGFMGLSFAIPINVAQKVAMQLRSTGRVSRGWLGVVIQDVTKELADSFGLKEAKGALVSNVQKGSPAQLGGVKVSDIILKFNGLPIVTDADLPRAVSEAKAGSMATLTVWRQGKLVDLQFKLGEMPSDHTLASNEPESPHANPHHAMNKLGLSLANLSRQQKEQYGVTHGVAVEAVSGLASDIGMQPGDIILSINNVAIKNTQEFDNTLSKIGSKKVLALLIKRGDTSQFVTIKLGE